ncbi:MAG: hypothetical protein ACRBHB_04350, partial [Arenicella sp.]
MRQNLYHTLSDEFHTQEMKQIQKSSDWYCYFIQDDTFSQIGMVELSSRNIVDGCLTSPVAYLEGLYLLGPVHTKFLTESMTKICSDEAEIMMLSRSKHIIS